VLICLFDDLQYRDFFLFLKVWTSNLLDQKFEVIAHNFSYFGFENAITGKTSTGFLDLLPFAG